MAPVSVVSPIDAALGAADSLWLPQAPLVHLLPLQPAVVRDDLQQPLRTS